MPAPNVGLLPPVTIAISVEYSSISHNGMLSHHSTHARSHHPWMTPDALPNTFVPATVVKNANPRA